MASAPGVKAAVGNFKLQPYYVGTSVHKKLTGQVERHTHYVLIESKKATRLGLTASTKVKSTDTHVDGVVFQKERKGKKGKHFAKRFLNRYSSGLHGQTIRACTGETVKNKAGKSVEESYSISFPSSVSLKMIKDFFIKNCPKVIRINTGSTFYRIR